MPTVPNEGEVQLLSDLLTSSARENWLLKLIKADFTEGEADTTSTYMFADFDGYADKTLTRTISGSTWSTPALQAPSGSPAWSAESLVAYSAYGSAPQVFTCNGSTGNTIYGYAIVGATSGKVIKSEKFATPRALANGDTLSLTPTLESA